MAHISRQRRKANANRRMLRALKGVAEIVNSPSGSEAIVPKRLADKSQPEPPPVYRQPTFGGKGRI